MATSGSTDWQMTRNEIIDAALRRCGVLAQGENATASQLTEGIETLNRMVKSWQTFNIFLWTIEWKQKTFSAPDEVTGTDGSVYTCILGHTSASATKPITGANWSSFWVKRGDTGGVWTTATAYATPADFDTDSDIIDIQKAFIRDGEKDYPVELVSKPKFMELSDKNDESRPLVLFFDKQLTSHIYLYPHPDDTTDVLHYQAVRRLEDFDNADDNADFPVQWIEALVSGLAYKLSLEYPSVTSQKRKDLYSDSKVEFNRAGHGNRETMSSYSISSCY
jgi:hypothetical protein